MAPRKAKEPVAAVASIDQEDLMRRRDAFVTSMAMLRNAAEEASRAGLAYFDLVAHGVNMGANGDAFANFARAMSAPPGRAQTDELDAGDGKRKRKRTVKIKDPNAPKKPATPFFLFCSEGRATVKSDMGEGVAFQDIQHELKRRWEELTVDEKKSWSQLYQVKLADWKKVNEAYQTGKAVEAGAVIAEEVAAGASAPASPDVAAGGFTAVNHSADIKPLSAETADDSDSDSESDNEDEAVPVAAASAVDADGETDADADADVEEDDEDEVEETEAAREQADSSDSSLTPPPAEKEKPKTPRGRKPRATPAKAASAVAETPVSEKKTRKTTRAKKVKEAEAETDVQESPKRKQRKRRKSGTE